MIRHGDGDVRIIAVVQARFGSRRLPGKVLRPMQGRPMLGHLLEALAHCSAIDGLVVATSTAPSDDAVASFAGDLGVACHRGSLDDVAGRILDAAIAQESDAVVRVSGDSPLIDPALVDRGVALFRSDDVDLVSNVVRRTFPKGQSVEVISRKALALAAAGMRTREEREHVTPYFYGHPEDFDIRSFEAAQPRPEINLSVDTEADFERCEAILGLLAGAPWEAGWQACVRACDAIGAAAPT